MLISIALATYNGEKYIREQLDSILLQSYTNFELIICDDHSTDSTIDIIKSYLEKDSRISLYQNEINIGFLKNFEKILSFCKGDYIACCDQDDIWNKNHLETLISNIDKNDCIGANAELVDEKLISLNKTLSQSMDIYIKPYSDNMLFQRECYHNLIQGTASLFSNNLLQYILPFPQGIKFHDHWIALNACIRGGCKYIPETILQYRCHSQNITGYQKFNFFHALQTIKHSAKYRKTIYAHNLAMLQAILPTTNDIQKKEIVQKAIKFFSNLSKNQHKFATAFFYIKNYESITLCPRRKWKLFFYRVFCILMFGIMQ
ncbi:glycosyltransferase family 2 protein [Fibrobacter succinogenes]|uniref:glycosyltransferase family 2 protein n=1 Tax=Fibrobacter succinogenes TaxID=833 RepID=UPI00156A644C|nr:glycosyltransferase family 2 protein [Fibrobacter succinogenes]